MLLEKVLGWFWEWIWMALGWFCCFAGVLLYKGSLKTDLVMLDVIYIASTRDETGPGASGQVQDLQGHHQDDQEQLLDHF